MNNDYQQAIRHWTVAQPIVSAYVASVVKDFRDRDDVLQEIAVAVLESYAEYDPLRPFVAWTLGIARNQIGTYLRSRKRNRLVFDHETVELLAKAFEQTEQEQPQSLAYLKDCLGKLESRARQLCVLRYESDLKPAAIAGLLSMTPNAVAKSLQRIREQLRQCVERQAAMERGGA